jgi:hypothetical protein
MMLTEKIPVVLRWTAEDKGDGKIVVRASKVKALTLVSKERHNRFSVGTVR